MEEGSPRVYMKCHRFTKRVRASEDFNPEDGVRSEFGSGNFIGAQSEFGFGSFKDKLTSEKGPSIQFSDRAMDPLSQPWKHALIIKLLGRSHAYNYIHDRLQQKWSLKGDWKLIDLVNDCFVVKFDLEEDLNFVLTGGP
ncbi:hypothetical protein L3X38_011118 [Prunus dulcis]|uniref:DUF4283 domain-containing protein n=1 Tax=Prunus dulcis TaxID=3755 RepID=A0AAD4WJ29_PRUDU|nr:hypothetical protein L3X38_011118 [Prunus dulcis]